MAIKLYRTGWLIWMMKMLSVKSSFWPPVPEGDRLSTMTYPTVRLRLDKIIQKILISEDTAAEPYIALIKRLALNEKLD